MAEEQAAKTEVQGAETAAQGEKKSDKKKKKINRLSLSDINSKIEELEKANHIRSKYYQHLLLRRNELQSSE